MRMRWFPGVVVAMAVAGAGCGDSAGAPAVCSTKSAATMSGESPLMNPGGDCIGCHARGEGPRFQIAGTVMGDYKDDENCNGLEGITVQITGADGQVLALTTNAAGNFFNGHGDPAVALPFKAKLIGAGGKERAMLTAQSDGNCATCHTTTGANSAPGRIIAPM
jgi:hypothetical protein